MAALDLVARVESMRQQSATKAEAQRAAVREAMPDDMAEFLDEMKAEFGPDLKLTFLKTATLELGKEGGCGLCISQMVIGPLAITATGARGRKG